MLRALFSLILAGWITAPLFGAGNRSHFDRSIMTVPANGDAAHPRRGRIVRSALRDSEKSATMTFEVALRMRNFDDLQTRLARGERISPEEMAASYFPLPADEARTVAWLRSQGLIVTHVDSTHLAVFGRGTVTAVAAAFQASFARVSTPDGEFTSAVTAPSLPADLATAVIGIHGLQPQLRHRPVSIRLPNATPAATGTTYLPQQIASAYNATGLNLNGAGQTIAIIDYVYPLTSDLAGFWPLAGVTTAPNVTFVNIESGPVSAALSSDYQENLTEATLDVEWAGALAPGAAIRVYGMSETDSASWDLAFQRIYADLANIPSLHVASISLGLGEEEQDHDYLAIQSQYMANLAAAGVTIFAASGDDGSNGGDQSYPASDPNVTGVGGTTLTLAGNSVANETGWGNSGGGTSVYFPRPAWQTGQGVASGNYRLVPDVAATADPNFGASVYLNGASAPIGGTSWATPVWAAFCAVLDQGRANAGQSLLGPLNPRIYPLLGTSAFRDITSGANGAYRAGIGYDEVTGLGVPNVSVLAQSSLSATLAPSIGAQFTSTSSVAGQTAAFFVSAAGSSPLTYQWQRMAAGTSIWTNLSNTSAYAGATSSLLLIQGTTTAMNGDQFQCVASNSSGAATSTPVKLTVNSVGMTTLAGWPMSGGRVDGTGWAARFDFLSGIAMDSSGNLYVSDSGNTVRKVTTAGVVTTLAGNPGVAGSADGTGTAASFNEPAGVAIDAQGNLYVPDAGNYTIRMVSPAGVVSTIAGTVGKSGSVDATGTAAQFADPEAITIDGSGNLYVADGKGDTIRKITAGSWMVTTVAGIANTTGSTNGSVTVARFNSPEGLTVDSSGNLYVSDTGNNLIREISSAGVVSTLAGSGRIGSRDGTGTSATFNAPADLRIDSFGNLYIADQGNSTIRELAPSGAVTTIAGIAGQNENIDGPYGVNELDGAVDLTLGPGGVIYVADSYDFTVRRLVPGSVLAPTVSVQPSSATVNTGQMATFTTAASASSTTPIAFQWQVEPAGSLAWSNLTDNGTYSGSATATLSVVATVSLSSSQYRCVLANNAGSATSASATLTVNGPPVYLGTAQSVAVSTGGSTTLAANAAGSGLSYQWSFNGTAIAGATGSTYTLSNFSLANTGTYSVTVTNSYGSTTATVATVSLASTRLFNLSASALVNSTSSLSAGFVLSGSGTKSVLVRGIGPALTAFGIASALPTPTLSLVLQGSGASVASNTGWSTGSNTAALQAVFAQTGAFALSVGSADCALLQSLSPANYTATVAASTGTAGGTAVAEIYDADTGGSTARLANLSCLATVSTGNPLSAGFSIGGSGSETVLIRGSGPALGTFGVANPLSDPVLTLYQGGSVLATNSGWSTILPSLSTTFSAVGAFAFTPGSHDAALLETLPAGVYSAQVTSASGSTGASLIEIYEVSQ